MFAGYSENNHGGKDFENRGTDDGAGNPVFGTLGKVALESRVGWGHDWNSVASSSHPEKYFLQRKPVQGTIDNTIYKEVSL